MISSENRYPLFRIMLYPVTGELANLAKAVTLLPIRAQKMAIDDHARPGYPSTNTTTLSAGITIS
jgi:hypothetical protein